MQNRVCLLAAGKGTRMGPYSQNTNKALLPLNGKAIISHIIEKFNSDTEFVVALGYRAQDVKDYLSIAHSKNKFSFVDVDNFDGPGSGPGLSIQYCRPLLGDEPFYFVPCDSLWEEDVNSLPTDRTWLAVKEVEAIESAAYCNFDLRQDKITEIRDKVASLAEKTFAWTGLAFIYDSRIFWESLETKKKSSTVEKQISDGFFQILEQDKLYAYKINWTDVGTFEKYRKELHRYSNYDFSKQDEHLYFIDGKVIKFFQSKTITAARVKKAELNKVVFPKLLDAKENFYSYQFTNGRTLYHFRSQQIFKSLLFWLEKNLWKKNTVVPEQMQQICFDFYFNKTNSRNKIYLEKKYSEVSVVNQQNVPTVESLLGKINWKDLCQGSAFFIHGDLQPDNIIFDAEIEKFCLLDWRQDFSGIVEYGDIYYDFAKLLGGIRLNYQQVKMNNFSYSQLENECELAYTSHDSYEEFKIILKDFVESRGYSFDKVEILVGLIYLNMAPLHHAPFDQLLYALGKKILNEKLRQ